MDTIGVDHIRTDKPAKLEEVMPVASVAGKARSLEAEHRANASLTDSPDEIAEARAVHRAARGPSEIGVDHRDILEAVTAGKLDELLWTFMQGSFIPHRVVRGELDAPPLEPVLIGVNQPPGPGRWDVLVNLATDVPDFFSRSQSAWVKMPLSPTSRRSSGTMRASRSETARSTSKVRRLRLLMPTSFDFSRSARSISDSSCTSTSTSMASENA